MQMAAACSSSSAGRLSSSRCVAAATAAAAAMTIWAATLPVQAPALPCRSSLSVLRSCRHAAAPAAPLRGVPRQAAGARRQQRRRSVAAAAEVEEDLWQVPDREQWYHAKWWVLMHWVAVLLGWRSRAGGAGQGCGSQRRAAGPLHLCACCDRCAWAVGWVGMRPAACAAIQRCPSILQVRGGPARLEPRPLCAQHPAGARRQVGASVCTRLLTPRSPHRQHTTLLSRPAGPASTCAANQCS